MPKVGSAASNNCMTTSWHWFTIFVQLTSQQQAIWCYLICFLQLFATKDFWSTHQVGLDILPNIICNLGSNFSPVAKTCCGNDPKVISRVPFQRENNPRLSDVLSPSLVFPTLSTCTIPSTLASIPNFLILLRCSSADSTLHPFLPLRARDHPFRTDSRHLDGDFPLTLELSSDTYVERISLMHALIICWKFPMSQLTSYNCTIDLKQYT